MTRLNIWRRCAAFHLLSLSLSLSLSLCLYLSFAEITVKALREGAENSPAYATLVAAVRAGTRAAVWVAERV